MNSLLYEDNRLLRVCQDSEPLALPCPVLPLLLPSAPVAVSDGRPCKYDRSIRCFMHGRCNKCRLGKGGDWDISYPLPSLVINRSSSAVTSDATSKAVWSRQQKRGYHRTLSCLGMWRSQGYQMLRVDLTTAGGGDARALAEHHNRLRKRVERLGFPGIHHFQIKTAEGNGVLHIVWAWKCPDGMRQKRFYVRQSWLSTVWQEIHGARVTWIQSVGTRERDVRGISRYFISQYFAGQSGYEYMSYSWKRAFGFPLVSAWRKFKEMSLSFSDLLRTWYSFLAGEVVWCGYGGFTMGSLRVAYSEHGSEVWEILHWR
jgi:hypothetical protein